VRCIHCGERADYRARQATGACKACGRRFAFEPRTDKRMTDMTFKLAIEGVSDRGQFLWTDDQLYYDLCRRVRRRRLFHRLVRRPVVSLSRPEFSLLYTRWIDAHGVPEGRLYGRQFEPETAAAPPDAEAYGFESLVVCDSEAIADVLLANGFHAEAKCPVLAFNGYPHHISAALLPLLRERPPETILVVHDASWDGCALAEALTESPQWFAGVEVPRIVDAGLRPRDAKRYRGLYQRASHARVASAGTPPDEAEWLGKYVLELAVARPRVLMSVLSRVLRGEAERGAGGDDGVWVGAPWGEDDDEVG
jgi:hypothetical protein